MSVKRINITHLLEGGKRLNPVDLIIHYRFRKKNNLDVIVSISGTTNNSGHKVFGVQSLFKPVVWNDFNTDIFQINQQTCTGLWIDISNAESVEIKKIDFCFNEASKLTGRKMDYDANRVSIVSYVINDGSIFSPAQTVLLNNVCNGGPIHYRASRYSDFDDTEWKSYSANPTFELYSIGVNRVYFQVKNDISISEVIYREIAWHGYEEAIVVEQFVVQPPSLTDGVSISNPITNDNQFSSNIEIPSVEFNDEVIIVKV